MKVLWNLLVLVMVLVLVGCGPEARRGGPGTENEGMDDPAMSLKLEKLNQNLLFFESIREG